MSFEEASLLLVTLAAIPVTLFVLWYLYLNSWWASTAGWGRMFDSFALAALLDVALIAHWRHWMPPNWFILTLYGFIGFGAWLTLAALAWTRLRKR